MNRQLPAPPAISASLQSLIDQAPSSAYGARGDDPGFRIARDPVPPTPEQVFEAQKLMERYIAVQTPNPRTVRDWLETVNMTVSVPAEPTIFAAKCAALTSMLAEYPASVFTEHTKTRAMKAFQYFPSGKELADFLDAEVAKIRNVEAKIRRVANYKPPTPEPRGPPTDAEKEGVTASLAAWRAEQMAAATEELTSKFTQTVKPLHVPDEELLSQYEEGEKLGNSAAAYRAKWLRKKLGRSLPTDNFGA